MPSVLIIEDDARIAKSLEMRLKFAGYGVSTAADGMGGVLAAVNARPDLILLDIGLPAGGGFAVTDWLASRAATSVPPVIFITASKDPAVRARAMACQPVAFFEKPYSIDDLLATIAARIGPGSADPERRAANTAPGGGHPAA